MTTKITDPELAVLDADIIVVRAACWADKNGSTLAELEERIAFDVNYWIPDFCNRHVCAVSCPSKDNYRYGVYANYKSNRKGKEPPRNLKPAREIMHANHPVVQRDRLEADDLMGLAMSSGMGCAVSLDKDMESVPGWLWNPDKMCFPILINEAQANIKFHEQWLKGDPGDGIPGAKQVGEVKARNIVAETNPENIVARILQEYEDRGHDYEYCIAMARLVRILRDGEYDRATGDITLYEPNLGRKEDVPRLAE